MNDLGQRPHRGHEQGDQAGETRRLRIQKPGQLPSPSTVALHPANTPIVSEESDGARLRSKSQYVCLLLMSQTHSSLLADSVLNKTTRYHG
jgi:hypothetical protein